MSIDCSILYMVLAARICGRRNKARNSPAGRPLADYCRLERAVLGRTDTLPLQLRRFPGPAPIRRN